MSLALAGQRPVVNLHALTGARFVAAVAVLFCHFGGAAFWPAWTTAYGEAAVAFFFVLSGFILTFNYVDRLPTGDSRAYFDFLRARIARIAPVYLLIVVISTLMMCWIYSRDPLVFSHRNLRGYVGIWSTLLMMQSYIPDMSVQSDWCGPAWSVSCEATFYAAFPLILWRIRHWSLRRIACAAAVLMIVGAIWIATAYLVVQGVFHKPIVTVSFLLYRSPYIRITDFTIGCLAGMWYVRGAPMPWRGRFGREAAAWGALAIAGALAVLRQYGLIAQPLMVSTGFVPAFVILILALTSGPSWMGWLLSGPAMLRLGEASYSLYMLHGLPCVLLAKVYAPVTTPMALFAMVGCVLASLGLFHAVEDPCRKWFKKPATRPVFAPTPTFAEALAPMLDRELGARVATG
ncbi:MAG: acyltransferase family protein [Phycisphaerales bacterium]|nr:acyltransferase family protein [Phycisphaerales bacterium]